MKKSALLLFSLLFMTQLFSQITITSADMPASGDTIRTSIGVNPGGIYDFARTGNNLIWDFTGLENIGQQVDTFLTVTQTPIIFWPFFLTSANLARKVSGAGLIPGLPVENAFQYFNKTSSAYSDIGTGLVFSGLPIPLKYTDPDVLYRFPMSVGFQDTVDSYLEVSVPDLGYLMVDRNRINIVDGWGVLKSPYGEFEVLRLKSIVSEYDSIYIDSLGVGFPIQRDYIEYKWLGQGFGIPLLQVTIDTLLQTENIVFVDSIRDINVGIGNLAIQPRKLKVWPNPAANYIELIVPEVDDRFLSIRLADFSGRTCFVIYVSEKKPVNIPIRIDLSSYGLSGGVYILTVQGREKVYTSKLLISH